MCGKTLGDARERLGGAAPIRVGDWAALIEGGAPSASANQMMAGAERG